MINRGKQFEGVVKDSFKSVKNTSVLRLPDQTNGYKGGTNPCDFIVYHYPLQYFIECKSVHGRRFPLSNVTKNQRESMLEASKLKGVVAGVLVWYVDYDRTVFMPIEYIQEKYMDPSVKSIPYNAGDSRIYEISGRKKRVFFDYDMQSFINHYACEYLDLVPDALYKIM